MNLTAVTEEAEVMTRHVGDSLALVPPLKRAYSSHCCSDGGGGGGGTLNLVDVGSGAGLPGLIFAIACPSEFFNLPSFRRGKKNDFFSK